MKPRLALTPDMVKPVLPAAVRPAVTDDVVAASHSPGQNRCVYRGGAVWFYGAHQIGATDDQTDAAESCSTQKLGP